MKQHIQMMKIKFIEELVQSYSPIFALHDFAKNGNISSPHKKHFSSAVKISQDSHYCGSSTFVFSG
jgi:hypothetical protein